jgi:hypothetical protein
VLVSDLKAELEGVNERSLPTALGDLSVDTEATELRLKDGTAFVFDEQLERSVSDYLGVNKSYLAKCPPDLKAMNMNYWLQRRPEAGAVIEAVGDHLVTIHKPGLVVLPLMRISEVLADTFDPSFEIVNLIRDNKRFHIDILTPHHIEVPKDDRIEGRKEVGDITHGGVRILANPTEVKSPKVISYLHRLFCTNGSTSPEKEGTIRIKGRTVDEVIASLEAAAQQVMGELDDKLASYAALATRRPPGSPIRFAYQLGQEYKLPQRVIARIMERVNILPEDATLYDIQQIFTQLANGNVNYQTMTRLQSLGGDMAFNTDHIVHRCQTCERLLPDDV